MDQIKRAKISGMGEDDQKIWSEEIQDTTNSGITKIDDALEIKQSEIMQV